MQIQKFSDLIATLVTNGFHIYKVDRLSSANIIIHTIKYDRLGAEIKYGLLFSQDKDDSPVINSLLNNCKRDHSKPIYINDNYFTTNCSSYSNEKFFDFFGGIINSGLLLVPNLPELLNELGHNKLPNGLTGNPNDLHELYICEAIQFILASPVRRYGSDRLFQKLPDGVVLGVDFMLLVDSKAYVNGFIFQADDIERFSSYVKDFNKRYSAFFGNVFSFIVVSGHFNDSDNSILNRSEELYKKCGCKLSCISSQVLAEIVQLVQTSPEIRGSIDWQNIFSPLIIKTENLKKEITRVKKDKLH